MKAVFFGSIGVLAETSELQRRAYNTALDTLGVGLQWNVATYCSHINTVGGKNRLASVLPSSASTSLLTDIHELKQKLFLKLLAATDIAPRPGVLEALRHCKEMGLKTGLITTTTQMQLEGIFTALSQHLDPSDFDIITNKSDVIAEKPSPDIYTHALSMLNVSAGDVAAIEDTEMNQAAASKAGITCYLLAGNYATIRDGVHQISSAEQIFENTASSQKALAKGAA